MLSYQRSNCLDQVYWNRAKRPPTSRDLITTFECWKYQHVDSPKQDVNFRILHLANQTRREGALTCDVEERLGKWLALEVNLSIFLASRSACNL